MLTALSSAGRGSRVHTLAVLWTLTGFVLASVDVAVILGVIVSSYGCLGALVGVLHTNWQFSATL
jgi:hypothetical protein